MARIFFAPQELEDAREYSETLGYLTERRESRSLSYSAGRASSSSVSRSEERRALMLPQELREMDAGMQIIILRGVKPILTQKIRYFEDPNFTARLAPAPEIPRIDMGLYQACVEGHTRELRPEELSHVVPLEHRVQRQDDLPPSGETASSEELASQIDTFFDQLGVPRTPDSDPDGEE
jgi:type IV secretion system protein VirD4